MLLSLQVSVTHACLQTGGALMLNLSTCGAGHPPDFYSNVAGKLEKIAQTSIKKRTPGPQGPLPGNYTHTLNTHTEEHTHKQTNTGTHTETQGHIQANPFLRTSLSRLSYASFAKLLDSYSNAQVAQVSDLPPSESPTLRRIAVSMEVSRRIVTATGTQRTQGYAERYMETFVPWVKQHGGWKEPFGPALIDLTVPLVLSSITTLGVCLCQRSAT
uniref:Uncharacterized protein n=1 Tax=Oryzias latipes TaxID=8090 RepID=A0A3P9L7H6_ORYLA